MAKAVRAAGAALAGVAGVLLMGAGSATADAAHTRPDPAPGVQTVKAGTVLPGTSCPAFPTDNVWNTVIAGLPVDSNSATWLASMDASTTDLHPDFGPSGGKTPYGIPWVIVSPTQTLVPVKFQYASQSNKGPYPFSSTTPIEGGPNAGGDRHAIMVNPSTCVLYELWHARWHATSEATAGSGAIWTLTSNALRPAGWTSADAAGLPVLPGLVNYDEASAGSMDHAIRFTVDCTQQSYLWPARHEAGQANSSCPPMGARFRLEASFTLPTSKCAAICQTLVTTLKTYGMIIADNGSNWYFQGTEDTRWTYADVDQMKQIPASAFQAVDESCLMVSPNSGQAYQPGSAGYVQHCG